jgi:predicted amidohydrolase
VKIGYLQLRPQFGRTKDNVRAAKSMLAGVTDATVVLPELFNTGYVFRNIEEVRDLAESTVGGFTVTELKKVATAQKLNLVFGMAEVKNRKYYNSSVLITSKGAVHVYQKAHLFDRHDDLLRLVLPGSDAHPRAGRRASDLPTRQSRAALVPRRDAHALDREPCVFGHRQPHRHGEAR